MIFDRKRNPNRPEQQAIYNVALGLLSLFIFLLLNITYIQIINNDFLNNHPLNRRNIAAASKIKPGDITDRHGEQLAYSHYNEKSASYTREYPYGSITAHIIGYDTNKYGRSGLEANFSSYLTGLALSQNHLGPISHLWPVTAGNSLRLTIDSQLQTTAYNLLGNRRGAIVAIVPRTGEILAMVSKPAYNPSSIEQNWATISQDSSSPLLNRATQGLYPPGSTLKVMIAEASLAEKITTTTQHFICNGTLPIGADYILSEPHQKAHGNITLEEALAVSCNITFGSLALDLGPKRMKNTFQRYGFDQSLEGELQEITSQLPNFDMLNSGELAQTGIGQGSLLVTPLHMAMLASCFANQGTIMKPYLVDSIYAPDGSALTKTTPKTWLTPTTPQLAKTIAQMMTAVVAEGTGRGAKIPGVSVAGKTGTAENPHGQEHAWFIGFAPADNPQIAIAIIVENAGAGGEVAAPLAQNILSQALR